MPEFGSPMWKALIALALPLVGAIWSVRFGLIWRLPKLAHVPAVLSFATAFVLSFSALIEVYPEEGPLSFAADLGTWFSAGQLTAKFTFTLDPLSLTMLCTVTFIATWITVFSASYMHGDEGYARYFAVMGLFVFFMCLLVLANNVFVLVAGWEGVGLCSYLLVGYYYAKPSAAAAARKAFLVTRLGDVGMILGLFLLWRLGGYHTDLTALFAHIEKATPSTLDMTAICLLLFCGAVGKSAQFPLYVWLPDAMEGPTPVSALIHAATMVTAGVYLLARCAPLFVLSPDAQLAVAIIGGLTAFLAAFLALAQNDLKRVLAYSTVSQLGFMFMALGCGGVVSPKFTVVAAIFHLFTHAFFKALLFLGSGSVMHAMGNVIDMRKFGGLRKVMPITHATFLIGALALAGFPLLSGFWSKDHILHALSDAGDTRMKYHNTYFALFVLAAVTALMTAFYTFRAYFLTFWGETKVPEGAHGHGHDHHGHAHDDEADHGHGLAASHESPWAMTVPLVVLAVFALGVGLVVDPLTHGFGHFLDRTPSVAQADHLYLKTTNMAERPHEFSWAVAGLSVLLAGVGILAAAALYGCGGPEPVPAAYAGLHAMSANKLFVDEVYEATLVKPAEGLAVAGRQFDSFLDALARLLSYVPRFGAALLRPLQNGLVQFYALGMVLGVGVFLTVILVRSAK